MRDLDKSNIHELDMLKVIIMFCVIFFHSFMSYVAHAGHKLWPLIDKSYSILIDPVMLLLVTFGMPLCIFLSGFLLYLLYKKKGLDHLIKNRLKKMLLPFLISLPFLNILLHPYFPIKTDSISIMGKEIYTYHLWFAYYLMMVIMLFYFVGVLVNKIEIFKNIGNKIENILLIGFKYRYSWLLFPFIALFLPGDLNDGVVKIDYSLAPNFSMFSSYVFLLYIGWLLNKNRNFLENLVKNCYRTLAIAAISHIVLVLVMIKVIDVTPLLIKFDLTIMQVTSVLSLLVMWGFTVGLFAFCLRVFETKNKILDYLAKSSFAIYVIHFPICILYINILMPYELNAFSKGLLVFLLTSLSSFALYEIIRRITTKKEKK